jgi:alkaline phosphatase D
MTTGDGAIGVEFATSAVTSSSPIGLNITIDQANNYSQWLIINNEELQWSELYYRGYYELNIAPDKITAQYFGLPTVSIRSPYEIPLANFTVHSGENKLNRPFENAMNGALKGAPKLQAKTSELTPSIMVSRASLI